MLCYMNRHCRYWTFNDKQLQCVVSQFCGHNCIRYCLYHTSGIDMRKIVRVFTSVLVCRIRKWKRISNVQTSLLLHTHTHARTRAARAHARTHAHTHTLLMSLLLDQFDDAPAQVQMNGVVDVRVPFTSLYIVSRFRNGWHSGHSNAPIWFWWSSCR